MPRRKKYSQTEIEIDDADHTRQKISKLADQHSAAHKQYEATREKMMNQLFTKIMKIQQETIDKLVKQKGCVDYPLRISMVIKKKWVCRVKGCEHTVKYKGSCDFLKTRQIIHEKLEECHYQKVVFRKHTKNDKLIHYDLSYLIHDDHTTSCEDATE